MQWGRNQRVVQQGSDVEGGWGCRAQKAWLLSVPYPLIPTAPVSVGVPSCVFSAPDSALA